MKFLFVLITTAILSLSSFAAPVHGPTPEQRREMDTYNRSLAVPAAPAFEVARPFAEYEKTGYLIMNSDTSFNSEDAKRGMLRNLPEGVTAVILTASSADIPHFKQHYSQFIRSSRLKVLSFDKDSGFWARDSLPIPVFEEASGTGLGLVDAKYHHGNEPDEAFAKVFDVPLNQHGYHFEGGNFMADTRGNCFTRSISLPMDVYRSYYGCKDVHILKGGGGIGHIDERLKIISDKIAVTDEPSYIPKLERLGYEVHELPKAGGAYETFANSVLIHDTVFMPAYGNELDKKAAEIYKSLGFKVFALPSQSLSNSGKGSLHCITMTYPPTPWKKLEGMLRATSR